MKNGVKELLNGGKERGIGTKSNRAMLLGDVRTRDECDLDIVKTENRLLDGERIRDKRTAHS